MRKALLPVGQSERGIALLKVVLLLFVALFVVFGAKIAYQKLTYKPPYRVVGDQFMTALAHKDASTSYALFSTNLKNDYTSSSWKEAVNSTFGNYTGTPKFAGSSTISDAQHEYGTGGNPYRLSYTLTLQGKAYTMYVVVFSEKGTWKVDQFSSVVKS
ncbi:MAG TPA: NTF2-like N-terminal transpeptidase domain-containing protein [Candidatus Saccharimonadales bacterium]|nr:NTF2-like N-terminal transpeptidase domain-containing protein [Candidatus Saccharimonadales bacterium]